MNSEIFSFDSVLPMSIWFDATLQPLDIKIYAIIRNLTRKHGYCYATNEHLSEIVGVCDRTVRRSLHNLAGSGYLEIETEKNGLQWQRRIYLSDNFKKCLRKDINVHPPGHMCPPPRTNLSTIKGISELEDYKNNCNVERPKSPIDAPPITTSLSEKEKASRYLFAKKQEVYGKATVPDFSKWNVAMERLNRLDKRSWEEIKEMIDWAFASDFWCKNIQCPATLRKQWDKMMMQRVAVPTVSPNVVKNTELFHRFREGLASKGQENWIKLEGKYIVARGKDYPLTMNPNELWKSICETFNIEYIPA